MWPFTKSRKTEIEGAFGETLEIEHEITEPKEKQNMTPAVPPQFRHGDVFIVKVDKIPKDAQPRAHDPNILAYGEVTGHKHKISAGQILEKMDNGATRRFLKVPEKGGLLTHEEHGPIEIPEGDYEVRIQREYTPQAPVTVRD